MLSTRPEAGGLGGLMGYEMIRFTRLASLDSLHLNTYVRTYVRTYAFVGIAYLDLNSFRTCNGLKSTLLFSA